MLLDFEQNLRLAPHDLVDEYRLTQYYWELPTVHGLFNLSQGETYFSNSTLLQQNLTLLIN